MVRGVIKQFLIASLLLLFIPTCFALEKDSTKTKKPFFIKTNPEDYNHNINRSNTILIGASADYRNYQLIFKNISANLIGKLVSDYNQDDFGKRIDKWVYTPSINQYNASLFLISKYGSFSYSHSLQNNLNKNISRLNALSFSIPFGVGSFSFEYLKYTGLQRKEPVFGSTLFLPDMTFSPMNIGVNIHIGKIKNPALYIPTKLVVGGNFYAGYSSLLVKNSTDFLPALSYGSGNPSADNIVLVPGLYMNSFSSYGATIGMNYGFIAPLIKPKDELHAQALYLKGSLSGMYNFQSYAFNSLSDTFSKSIYTNHQYLDNQKGFEGSANMYGSFGIHYDSGRLLLSGNASYYALGYGKVGSGWLDNHAKDLRWNINFSLAYRFNFKRGVESIDAFKSKLFKPKKTHR